jgi:hypothetical protein
MLSGFRLEKKAGTQNHFDFRHKLLEKCIFTILSIEFKIGKISIATDNHKFNVTADGKIESLAFPDHFLTVSDNNEIVVSMMSKFLPNKKYFYWSHDFHYFWNRGIGKGSVDLNKSFLIKHFTRK